MNVAMTRARRGLIVVGHAATLARDTHAWGPWLRWIRDERLHSGSALPRTLPDILEPPDWEAKVARELKESWGSSSEVQAPVVKQGTLAAGGITSSAMDEGLEKDKNKKNEKKVAKKEK